MSTPNHSSAWHNASISSKVSISVLVLVSALITVFLLAIMAAVTHSQEGRAESDLTSQVKRVNDLLDLTSKDVARRTTSLARALQQVYAGEFALNESATISIQDKPTPTLTLNAKVLNLDFTEIDRFTSASGSVASVFARTGDKFIRITTTTRNEKGERVMATVLDATHPAYKAIMSGDSYQGPATVFGKSYLTQYDPIKDAKGQIIGITGVGLEYEELLLNLKSMIRSASMGTTGNFYVLDARPGERQGQLVVHQSLEGKNVADTQDADGQAFVKDMLARKSGIVRYQWRDGAASTGTAPQRIAAFAHNDNWNWLVVGSMEAQEMSHDIRAMRPYYLGMGLLLVLLLTGALYLLLRRMVVLPLHQAADAAKALAAGDLTVRLPVLQHDEIGLLAHSINQIGSELGDVVQQVRHGSQSVANASAEIALGNNDLSARTEQQASALQQTAAAMEQLSGQVKQNADSASNANQLAASASGIAMTGGDVVGRVVTTMKEINDSSHKIADIISVIDGIAFQTNILALNAAVEAARAGEQGRGFAVVASEVRALAGRSAEAAREIKGLISASVARVAQGTAQVDEAGATMGQVVSAIQQVTDIMGQISSASLAQAAGVTQIGQAIANMDQATQQNATLVEQMAAAADSLSSQSEELVQTVAAFKLDGSGAVPVRPVGLPKRSRAPSARLAQPTSHVLPPQSRPVAATRLAAPPKAATPSPKADNDWETF